MDWQKVWKVMIGGIIGVVLVGWAVACPRSASALEVECTSPMFSLAAGQELEVDLTNIGESVVEGRVLVAGGEGGGADSDETAVHLPPGVSIRITGLQPTEPTGAKLSDSQVVVTFAIIKNGRALSDLAIPIIVEAFIERHSDGAVLVELPVEECVALPPR